MTPAHQVNSINHNLGHYSLAWLVKHAIVNTGVDWAFRVAGLNYAVKEGCMLRVSNFTGNIKSGGKTL